MIKKDIYSEQILREKMIKLALLQLGKDYIHGSNGPNSFDCAGLVWYIYNKILGIDIYECGYGLSTTTMILTNSLGIITIFNENELNKDLTLIKEGDILFFHRQSLEDNIPKIDNKYPGHCGIYLGNNKFIHCPRKKAHVVIDNINSNYWEKKLVASKNIIIKDK